MPPKASTAEAMRQSDALYIMDCIMDQTTPIMLNISEVAAGTGGKTNTIAKRFRIMRQRYPRLNILTSLRPASVIASSAATVVPSTPSLTTKKKGTTSAPKASVKKTVSKQTTRKPRQSKSVKAEDDSEIEDSIDEISDNEDYVVDDNNDGNENVDAESLDEISTAKVTKVKRKRSSTASTTRVRQVKKAKIASVSNNDGSADELASERSVDNTGEDTSSKSRRISKKFIEAADRENDEDSEEVPASIPTSTSMSIMPPIPNAALWNATRLSLMMSRPSTTPTSRSTQALSELDKLILKSADTPSPPEKSTQIMVDTPEYEALLKKEYSTLPPPLLPKSKKTLAVEGTPLPTAPLSEDTTVEGQAGADMEVENDLE